MLDGIDEPFGPVRRFQPALPQGLARFSRKDGLQAPLILDPIGACPQLIEDLVSQGYKVVVCAPNPVDRILLQFHFDPPTPEVIRSVYADLNLVRQEGQRLELHLQEMMAAKCGQCGKRVYCEKYTWNDDDNRLLTKSYNCQCGYGGEFPVDQEDLALAQKWERSDGLHRSAVVALFSPLPGVDVSDIDQYLGIYSPRVLHSLNIFANRLQALFPEGEKAECAKLLFLFLADKCSGMWNPLEGQYRPRQVQCPPRRVELNVWQALKEVYNEMLRAERISGVAQYPDLPNAAGVSVFAGSFRELAKTEKVPAFADVVTALPRPSQAYWVLSALWSRWILGCPTEEDFLVVLKRKRFDWAWYSEALLAIFKRLANHNGRSGLSLSLFITETEPEFMVKVAYALVQAGFGNFTFTASPGELIYLVKSTSYNKNSRKRLNLDEDQIRQILQDAWPDYSDPLTYTEVLALLLNKIGEDVAILLEYNQEVLKKDLQGVLEGPLFEDVAKRQSVETGMWIRKGQIGQTLLSGF